MITLCAQAYGDRRALVVDGEGITYTQLAANARRVAGRLVADGMRPGDRAAIWLPNSISFAEVFFGAALAGLIPVPVNTRLRRSDAVASLTLIQPRALFVPGQLFGRDYLTETGEILASSASLKHIPVLVTTAPGSGEAHSLADWLSAGPVAESFGVPVATSSLALISFTSGTTSAPKGASVSHDGALYIAREVGRRMEVTEQDRMISSGPFFHNGGLVPTLFKCLMWGCTLYSQVSFDVKAMLATIRDERCTLAGGVGTVFDALIDEPGFSLDAVASLRAIRAAAPVDIRRGILKAMPHVKLISLFGMAETSAAITLTRLTDSVEDQVGTNGSPIPESAIRIVDPEGNVLGAGESGEIQIGGRGVMLGYFGDSDATRAVMTEDGWLRSGDIGHLDERGNLVLTGRIKDTFRRGGESVACAEVESCIRSHPAVREVAVVGKPDRKYGEVGYAFVQLKDPDQELDPDELISFCARQLANFKIPAGIGYVRSFQLTGSGKVDKKFLVVPEDER
jgi:acyl-CoA synthetase (AMP-forming)/AMP-acid ligase II